MKVLIVLALVLGVVSAVPLNGNISPALRTVMMDMMKNMLKNMLPSNAPSPAAAAAAGAPSARPLPIQMPPGIPPPRFQQPPPGPAFVPSMGAPGPNNMGPPPNAPGGGRGLFMEMPANHYGGYPGYGGFVQREFCPPTVGPTGYNDACKDQILRDALYFSNGKPRYKWVTPLNPYDPSIPDNLKDYARHVLYKKVGARAPTPEEARLMSILGDHPGHHFGPPMGFQPPPRGFPAPPMPFPAAPRG